MAESTIPANLEDVCNKIQETLPPYIELSTNLIAINDYCSDFYLSPDVLQSTESYIEKLQQLRTYLNQGLSTLAYQLNLSSAFLQESISIQNDLVARMQIDVDSINDVSNLLF